MNTTCVVIIERIYIICALIFLSYIFPPKTFPLCAFNAIWQQPTLLPYLLLMPLSLASFNCISISHSWYLMVTSMPWFLHPAKHILALWSRSETNIQLHLLQHNYLVWDWVFLLIVITFGWSCIYWSELLSSNRTLICKLKCI